MVRSRYLRGHATHIMNHPDTLTKILTVRLGKKKKKRSLQRSAEEKLKHTIATIDFCPQRYPAVPTLRIDANVHSAKRFYKIVVHDRMSVAVSSENLIESEKYCIVKQIRYSGQNFNQ